MGIFLIHHFLLREGGSGDACRALDCSGEVAPSAWKKKRGGWNWLRGVSQEGGNAGGGWKWRGRVEVAWEGGKVGVVPGTACGGVPNRHPPRFKDC